MGEKIINQSLNSVHSLAKVCKQLDEHMSSKGTTQ